MGAGGFIFWGVQRPLREFDQPLHNIMSETKPPVIHVLSWLVQGQLGLHHKYHWTHFTKLGVVYVMGMLRP